MFIKGFHFCLATNRLTCCPTLRLGGDSQIADEKLRFKPPVFHCLFWDVATQLWGAFWTITIQCVHLYNKCHRNGKHCLSRQSSEKTQRASLSIPDSLVSPFVPVWRAAFLSGWFSLCFLTVHNTEAEAIKFRSDHRTVAISHRSRYSGNLSSCS